MKRRTSCRLCNSSRFELALDIKPSPIGDEFVTAECAAVAQPSYPLATYLCLECGHLQNLDIVEPKILFRNYTYQTSVSLGLVKHFEAYADTVVKEYSITAGSFVVELGSNDGSLLRAFQQHGMRVLGIDPAVNIAEAATRRGTQTIPDFFSSALATDIRRDHGAAKVVCANNVFAHIDDLEDIVKGVERLLDADGIFVFEASYVVDMIERVVFDTIYHEHVSHHALTPLTTFFQRLGLQLFDVERISTKGGSIRGFVQRADTGVRPVTERLRSLLQAEQDLNLFTPAPYRRLFAEIEKRKNETLQIVRQTLTAGGTVAAYGASTTTTTVLYHFELENLITAIFDDNELKQGRLSPGAHIPVYPSSAIYTQRPALIVILAWMYAEPIMSQHKAYIEDGGAFVLPLPTVKLYNAESKLSLTR